MVTKVMFKSAKSGRTVFDNNMDISFDFIVVNDNKSTTIDQVLTIERVEGGYRSSITLDEMPYVSTPQLSVDKLTDWLDRLSESLKAYDFESIKLKNL